MEFDLGGMLHAFSYGLDCVESQLMPIRGGHGKRVIRLSMMIGKLMGIPEEQLCQLGYLAAMHDNALTEYLREEAGEEKKEFEGSKLKHHCIQGEKNISVLPIHKDLRGTILYHHEEANGRGPFGKMKGETPLSAQIIHMTDVLDTIFYLGEIDEEKFIRICKYVKEKTDIRFPKECAEAFLNGISFEDLQKLTAREINLLDKYEGEEGRKEYSLSQVRRIFDLWIKIIDYKSEVTSRHSQGVATLAEKMGYYYNFDEEKCTYLYLSGAVHDVGKLTTDSTILEKPGKLTKEEFSVMQDHAYQSWVMLKNIEGLEDITLWAVHHHEKLNGEGYPFGKSGEEIGFEERLLACADIYQALTESRSYKEGFSHQKAIEIMRDMVEKGFIDKKITEDMAIHLGQ